MSTCRSCPATTGKRVTGCPLSVHLIRLPQPADQFAVHIFHRVHVDAVGDATAAERAGLTQPHGGDDAAQLQPDVQARPGGRLYQPELRLAYERDVGLAWFEPDIVTKRLHARFELLIN